MSEENQPADPKPETVTKDEMVLDKFNEIKARFEKELSEKDKVIEDLKKELEPVSHSLHH